MIKQHVKVNGINTANEFFDLTADKLLSDEVRYGLMYGLAEWGVLHDGASEGTWYLTLTENDEICSAVMRTPLQPILAYFSGDMEKSAELLAEAIHKIDPSIPGVVGDKNITDAFTVYWRKMYNNKVTHKMNQRVFKLTELAVPELSPGSFRKASLSEKDYVISWSEAFQHEALGEPVHPDHEKTCVERIQKGHIFIWIDGKPKSMAIKSRPGRNGIYISGVYTPPECRGAGYASSCVSSLCRELLNEYSYCALYTDLSNPASNKIYKRMGFKEHCDSVQYKFSK